MEELGGDSASDLVKTNLDSLGLVRKTCPSQLAQSALARLVIMVPGAWVWGDKLLVVCPGEVVCALRILVKIWNELIVQILFILPCSMQTVSSCTFGKC